MELSYESSHCFHLAPDRCRLPRWAFCLRNEWNHCLSNCFCYRKNCASLVWYFETLSEGRTPLPHYCGNSAVECTVPSRSLHNFPGVPQSYQAIAIYAGHRTRSLGHHPDASHYDYWVEDLPQVCKLL
jgi:hypothetical protein